MSEAEWIDVGDSDPPENQWIEVRGYLGSRFSSPTTHYQGRARWYRKPEDKEFFYWETEDGQEYGSWYFDVEGWREIDPS